MARKKKEPDYDYVILPERKGRPPAWQESDPSWMMYNALRVITLDPKVSEWLQENDPMAFKQAQDAVEAFRKSSPSR